MSYLCKVWNESDQKGTIYSTDPLKVSIKQTLDFWILLVLYFDIMKLFHGPYLFATLIYPITISVVSTMVIKRNCITYFFIMWLTNVITIYVPYLIQKRERVNQPTLLHFQKLLINSVKRHIQSVSVKSLISSWVVLKPLWGQSVAHWVKDRFFLCGKIQLKKLILAFKIRKRYTLPLWN